MEATQKQIEFAQKLGIENPQNYTKEALSKMINEKAPSKKPYQNAPNQVSSAVQQVIVSNRTDKPHSYEFGKAGARHKIYYGEIEELKKHIEELKANGLIEEDSIKPEDFEG